MKVVIAKRKPTTAAERQLVMGLEPPAPRDPDDKVKPITFVCSRKPGKASSPTYELKFYVFVDGEPPETFIDTLKHIEAISKGQGLKTNNERVDVVRQLFADTSLLTAFENELTDQLKDSDDEVVSDEVYAKCIAAMTKIVFPERASRLQRDGMRRLKKPDNMTFRVFANRMKKMNEYLSYFPATKNGTPAKPMTDYELLECLHNSLPNVLYKDEMKRQNYYAPDDDDFAGMCDWVENRCEYFDKKNARDDAATNLLNKPIPRKEKRKFKESNERFKNENGDAKSKPKGGNDGNGRGGKKRRFCMHHKWGDHGTHECPVVKATVAKLAPHKRNEKSEDHHLMDDSATTAFAAFLKSDEYKQSLKEACTGVCNQLFKGFKRKLEEENFIIDDEVVGPRNENDAYEAALNLDIDDEEKNDDNKPKSD